MQELERRYVRTLPQGSVLFREGDAAYTMYVLRVGRVRITRRVRGIEQTFAVLGPGEFFGEMAILNRRPRNASAVAIDDVTVVELDAPRFEAMISSQPEIAARIIQKLCQRLDSADERIAILLKRDPRARVLVGLMREMEERGFPGSELDSVVVQRDFDELSEEVGVKRAELDEVVARITRVGLAKPVEGGLELASLPRMNAFLSFLEERGIVRE